MILFSNPCNIFRHGSVKGDDVMDQIQEGGLLACVWRLLEYS